MRAFLLFGFILLFQITYAQPAFFTKEACYEKMSNAETSECLSEKTIQAKKYLEKEFDMLHKKVIKKLNSTGEEETIEKMVLNTYATNLPKLKTGMIENAFLYAEIMSASSMDGTGHLIFQNEFYLDELKKVYDYLQQLKKEVIHEE